MNIKTHHKEGFREKSARKKQKEIHHQKKEK